MGKATCCAYNCRQTYDKNTNISFHAFPKDPLRRKIWTKNVRRKNFTPKNHTKICSRHFEEDCFDREKFGGRWLKPTAVPTIFDFPSQLLAKKSKNRSSSHDLHASEEESNEEEPQEISVKILSTSTIVTPLPKRVKNTKMLFTKRSPSPDLLTSEEEYSDEESEEIDGTPSISTAATPVPTEVRYCNLEDFKNAVANKVIVKQWLKPTDVPTIIKFPSDFKLKETSTSPPTKSFLSQNLGTPEEKTNDKEFQEIIDEVSSSTAVTPNPRKEGFCYLGDILSWGVTEEIPSTSQQRLQPEAVPTIIKFSSDFKNIPTNSPIKGCLSLGLHTPDKQFGEEAQEIIDEVLSSSKALYPRRKRYAFLGDFKETDNSVELLQKKLEIATEIIVKQKKNLKHLQRRDRVSKKKIQRLKALLQEEKRKKILRNENA